MRTEKQIRDREKKVRQRTKRFRRIVDRAMPQTIVIRNRQMTFLVDVRDWKESIADRLAREWRR